MLGKYLKQVRTKAPLIHNITNYVTVNDVANVLLACGGSPIMSDEPADIIDITSICNGLNINIGTLNVRTIEAMSTMGEDMIKEKVTGYFKHRKKGNDKNERSCTCKSSGKLDQRSERFYLLQRQISPVFSAFSVCAGMGNHALGTYGQ